MFHNRSLAAIQLQLLQQGKKLDQILKNQETILMKIVGVDQDVLDQLKAQSDQNKSDFAALTTRIQNLANNTTIQADPAAAAELSGILADAQTLGTGMEGAAQPVATQPAPTPEPAPAP